MSNEECLNAYPWMSSMLSRIQSKSLNYRVTDFTVDSRKFCQQIEKFSVHKGAQFQYNKEVKELKIEDGIVKGICLHDGTFIHADLGKSST